MTCSEAGIFAPFHLLMQAMTVMSEGRRLRHSLWFTLVDPGMFVFVPMTKKVKIIQTLCPWLAFEGGGV